MGIKAHQCSVNIKEQCIFLYHKIHFIVLLLHATPFFAILLNLVVGQRLGQIVVLELLKVYIVNLEDCSS